MKNVETGVNVSASGCDNGIINILKHCQHSVCSTGL